MHRPFLFDTVIKNARIVDGTCTPWFYGDVGIQNGKIAFVGPLKNYRTVETVHADGRVLCPGFIDIHTHCDFGFFSDPCALSKILQGVTTIAIGQCGISPAPIFTDKIPLLHSYSGFIQGGTEPMWSWRTFGEWLSTLESLRPGVNVLSFVGHGTIRLNIMGFENREPSDMEIDEMKALVRHSMEEGAFGMSSGLIYPPGIYASPAEIRDVASPLKEYRGLYLSHIRNESSQLLRSLEELIALGEELQIPVQVHHLKVMGKQNWGQVQKALARIEKAREKGLDITADMYPYTATSTTLRTILPSWVQEEGLDGVIQYLENKENREKIIHEVLSGGDREDSFRTCNGPEGIIILDTPETPDLQGKTLREASKIMGLKPVETALEIILRNKGKDTCCFFKLNEKDVASVLSHPLTMVGSDSIVPAPGAKCHPRTNGTFSRVLSKYVREDSLLSLEKAVWKMSGFPATRAGLCSKGFIKQGMDADLIIFDPESIKENADFVHPELHSEGIDEMFINGRRIIMEGSPTGVRAGKVLRRE